MPHPGPGEGVCSGARWVSEARWVRYPSSRGPGEGFPGGRAQRGGRPVGDARVSEAASACRTPWPSPLPEARPGPTAINTNTCSRPAPGTAGPPGSSFRFVAYFPRSSSSSDVCEVLAPLPLIACSGSLSVSPGRAISDEVAGASGFCSAWPLVCRTRHAWSLLPRTCSSVCG